MQNLTSQIQASHCPLFDHLQSCTKGYDFFQYRCQRLRSSLDSSLQDGARGWVLYLLRQCACTASLGPQHPLQGIPICKIGSVPDQLNYKGLLLPFHHEFSGSVVRASHKLQVRLPHGSWWIFLPSKGIIMRFLQILANQVSWEAVWAERWLKPTSQSGWKLHTCLFLIGQSSFHSP